jgi:hypothetical protein
LAAVGIIVGGTIIGFLVGDAVNYPFIYGYVIASIVMVPAGIFAEFVISFFGGIFKK